MCGSYRGRSELERSVVGYCLPVRLPQDDGVERAITATTATGFVSDEALVNEALTRAGETPAVEISLTPQKLLADSPRHAAISKRVPRHSVGKPVLFRSQQPPELKLPFEVQVPV